MLTNMELAIKLCTILVRLIFVPYVAWKVRITFSSAVEPTSLEHSFK